MGRNELLEELALQAGCLYLSDLHEPRSYPAIRQAVKELREEKYGIEEWREAYQYITGKKAAGNTEQEIRRLFDQP